MRVFFCVRVFVVLQVMRRPPERSSLERTCTESGKHTLKPSRSFKAPMREVPMMTCCDTKQPDCVARSEQQRLVHPRRRTEQQRARCGHMYYPEGTYELFSRGVCMAVLAPKSERFEESRQIHKSVQRSWLLFASDWSALNSRLVKWLGCAWAAQSSGTASSKTGSQAPNGRHRASKHHLSWLIGSVN